MKVIKGLVRLALLASSVIGITWTGAAFANAYDFELQSAAFKYGDLIPEKHTCKGENLSPALQWSRVPKGTKALALIVDDPDAPEGVWNHWILFNIPADVHQIPEGVKPNSVGVTGMNSWQERQYNGPCPPKGEHRYRFRLFALDGFLKLKANADKETIEQEINDHLIDKTELLGMFEK